MALHCTTCSKHDYNLHPELKICIDCFKAGESEKENRKAEKPKH